MRIRNYVFFAFALLFALTFLEVPCEASERQLTKQRIDLRNENLTVKIVKNNEGLGVGNKTRVLPQPDDVYYSEYVGRLDVGTTLRPVEADLELITQNGHAIGVTSIYLRISQPIEN